MTTEEKEPIVQIPLSEYNLMRCRIARAEELSRRTTVLLGNLDQADCVKPIEVLDAIEMTKAAVSLFNSGMNRWS